MNEKKDFEHIYSQYYQTIFNYVHKKLPSYQEAEDLTQEALVACYRNWDSYDGEKASVRTWVFVIVKNRLKNYYRDKKWMDSLDDEESEIQIASGSLIEEMMLFEEYKAVLYDALDSLGDIDRQIIIGQYFYHKTSAEIADMLRIKPGNVRVRKNRALDKMRNYFRAHGYTDIK